MAFKRPLTGLMLATALCWTGNTHAAEPAVPTISVSATGTVEVVPDMATISIGVVREAETAREALNNNNAAMAEIIEALKVDGIADRDLQTSGLNIQPRYLYPKVQSSGTQEPPRIIGYSVSNNLDIRVRNVDNAGSILDKVVTLGVNSGGNILFTNQNPAQHLEKAREKAVKRAIAKARTLAMAANVGLGRILSISENHSQPRPVPMAQARDMAFAESAAVPIAKGENTYRVSVNISWEINQ